MPRRRAPTWSTRRMLDVLHGAQLREHGGAPGVRDEGLLESALARPQQKWAYAESPDLATLAAAYAFGLAKNHPFADGNKRIALIALEYFLELNGYALAADDAHCVLAILALAAGDFGEKALALWIRKHMKKV